MKIILTGATGYIGKHVLQRLYKNNDVWCTVRKSSDLSKIKDYASHVIIMETYDILYESFSYIKPDVVVHLAGMFRGEHSADDIEEMLDSNLVFSSILFDAACKAGCRNFINTGSYWQNYGGAIYNPVNLYAATKQAFEDIILYYVNVKKCTALTMQIFDSFGPGDKRNKILNIVSGLEHGETLCMSPGKQKLYFCYIEDIADAYECAIHTVIGMDAGAYRKYAIRDDKPYTLKQIVESYMRLSGKDLQLQWGGRAYREREIMDPEGIGEILPGWKPKHSLEDGLKKYVDDSQEDRRA